MFSLVEFVGCSAERNRFFVYTWLLECPLNVQAIGLGALVSSLAAPAPV